MLIDESNVAAYIGDTSASGALRVSREEAQAYAPPTKLDADAVADIVLPRAVLRTDYYLISGFKDQDGSGACTGFAWVTAMQLRHYLQSGQFLALSGSDFYWSERGADASWLDAGAPSGAGVSIGTVVGVCTDALWPDAEVTRRGERVFVEPSAAAKADRYHHKILEAVYVGEGTDAGIIDRMCRIIAAGGVLVLGIGVHCVPLMEYDMDGGWFRGPNSRGGPDVNNAGTIGIAFGIVGQCWNIYGLLGVDYRGLSPRDEIGWAALFHTQAEETVFRINTLTSGWTAMPTPPQVANVISMIQTAVTQLQSSAAALASLTDTSPSGPGQTTTVLTATPNPATVGTAITLRATVSGTSPTGSVAFTDGQTPLGTVSLTNGIATFVTALAVGSHSIKAAYAGDASNAASSSTNVNVTINAAGGGSVSYLAVGGPPLICKRGLSWTFGEDRGPLYGHTLECNGRGLAASPEVAKDAAGDIKMRIRSDKPDWQIFTGADQWINTWASTTAP